MFGFKKSIIIVIVYRDNEGCLHRYTVGAKTRNKNKVVESHLDAIMHRDNFFSLVNIQVIKGV